MPSALILADDLTGAADCAAQAVRHGLRATVALRPQPDAGAADVVALDLDTRAGSPAGARAATRAAARGAPELLYVKLDSLLRGHLGAAVDGALDASGAELALVAPAFPAQGRTTAGGVQHVAGEPVADLVARLREQSTRPVEAVGRDVGSLPRTGVLVCDAEDDADLARIAAAGRAAGRPLVWAGSAGLAAALFAGLAGDGPSPPAPARAGRGALVVVGSDAPPARAQLAALLARPRSVSVAVDPAAPDPRLAEDAVTRGDDAIVHLARAGGVAALAEAAALAAGHAAGLVLTGGETARAVCDRVGVRAIELCGEVEPGVPLGRIASPERAVVTKAGAFGDPGTLCRAVDAVRSARP